MAVVFIESKHILSKNMTEVANKYSFIYLPIAKREKNVMEKIVSSIYKINYYIRRERDFFVFYKLDLLLL